MAKIAFYFKDEKHLQESKLHIDKALTALGLSQDVIIVNTQDSKKEELEEFSKINHVDCKKRILLLIKKGMEGFDCPSLFATAIIRGASSSSNYILQASTRCLRNIYAEEIGATIYIDKENEKILEKELSSVEGVAISQFNNQKTQKATQVTLTLKTPLPQDVKIKFPEVQFRQNNIDINDIDLTRPDEKKVGYVERKSLKDGKLDEIAIYESSIADESVSIIDVAYKISDKYDFPYFDVYDKLEELYSGGREIYKNHIANLERQIERHFTTEITNNTQEKTIKLIKKEGFETDENGNLYTTININKAKESNLFSGNTNHYNPYNFDVISKKLHR